MQAALSHHRQQSDCLEGYGLSSRIGPCYYEGSIVAAYGHVYGNGLFSVYQRVAGLLQNQLSPVGHLRAFSLHPDRKLSLGEYHIQGYKQFLVVHDGMKMLCYRRGKLGQYSLYLRLLGQLQLPELVVQVDYHLRLYEYGGSCGRLVVDYAGEPSPVLCLDRHHVPAVSYGHYGVLQISLVVGGVQYVVEPVLYRIVLSRYAAPYVLQLRRGVVRHLVLGNYTSVDVFRQPRESRQHFSYTV